MTRNIITAIFFVIFGILMMINLISCSDMFENPYPWPGDLEVEEEPKYDLVNDAVTNQENSPGALQKENINSLFEIQKQYQQDCYKTEYFFCPPSLFLNEIWEFQLITDTCKDPEEVVYKGPCEQKFECDPSNTEPETVLCSVPVSTGGNI